MFSTEEDELKTQSCQLAPHCHNRYNNLKDYANVFTNMDVSNYDAEGTYGVMDKSFTIHFKSPQPVIS